MGEGQQEREGNEQSSPPSISFNDLKKERTDPLLAGDLLLDSVDILSLLVGLKPDYTMQREARERRKGNERSARLSSLFPSLPFFLLFGSYHSC